MRNPLPVSANTLFYSGLVLSVAFVFVPSLAVKLGFLAFFVLVNILFRRHIAFVPALLTCTAIVVFNLVPPLGRELFTIRGFPVTEGALLAGLDRAVTFEGLLLISKATVSRNLVLPGSLGRVISETFRYFGLISGRKTRISLRNSFASVDALMEEIEQEDRESGNKGQA